MQIINEFIKVILFEKAKIKKLKYMFRGIRDNKRVKEIWNDICMYGDL